MLHVIDLSRVDLNLFALFEVVRNERHVGRAAERLNLSPSAVSHGLGRLRRLLNDPLFLRTPKGVVPTARAEELAQPIAEILAQARRVVASAEQFDPTTSTRRFTIGSPDGSSAVFLSPLLAALEGSAPGVDIGVRQILPPPGVPRERAWAPALTDLESRAIDVAIIPIDDVPARFVEQTLYREEFVIAMRAGHPFADEPTLDRYCAMKHLLVSQAGEALGFVDLVLASQGRSRRIAATVPNFMLALTLVAETDLLAAFPRSLAATHARRFGIQSVEAPLPLPDFSIRCVATKVALMDAGVAWLFDMLLATADVSGEKPAGRRGASRTPAARVAAGA